MKKTHNVFVMRLLLDKGDYKQSDLLPLDSKLTKKELDRLIMIQLTGEHNTKEVVKPFEIGLMINNPQNITWGQIMA